MKPLRWHSLVAINFFWFGLNIRNNAVGTIFMPYLVGLFVSAEVRNTALGGMRTAGLVIAMLVQPVMGLLSDRSTLRMGRRRPFLIVGVVLDVLFLIWIGLAANYWSLLAAILFIQVSANISHGALQGLIPDLVPENQRGVASAIKAILELLPTVLLGVTIAPLVGSGQFGWAVMATCISLVIILLVTLAAVHETRLESPPDIAVKPALLRVLGMVGGILLGGGAGVVLGGAMGGVVGLLSRALVSSETAWLVGLSVGGVAAMAITVVVGVWAGVRLTLGEKHAAPEAFMWWVVNRLMFLAAITSIQSFAPYFLMYVFDVDIEHSTTMTGQLMTVVGVFTLLSALPAGWLSDRLGLRRIVGLSGILAAAGTGILLITVWAADLALIYAAGTVLGLATGLFVTTNWALGTRLAPGEQAGRYLGVSNLAGAGAGMVGAGIGGPLADALNAGMPGLGYFVIFAGYALLFLLGTLSLRKVHDGV